MVKETKKEEVQTQEPNKNAPTLEITKNETEVTPKEETKIVTKESPQKKSEDTEEKKEAPQEKKGGKYGRHNKEEIEWIPKTATGKKVKAGEIKNIDEILDRGERIMEVGIIDTLLPDAESDLLLIGQAKGKFGGGKRRAFRQTQKKTKEGNKPKFTTYAVVGNKNGYVGVGYGKAKETVPAREKAFRNAKLNVFKIRRGNGSWEDNSTDPHTIPYAVQGKCGSVHVMLIPAPKGTGLCIEKECAKILEMAGIQNVWSKIIGQSKTKMNTIKACESALKKLMSTHVSEEMKQKMHMVDGAITVQTEE
jgi:small subunit ribosomal protein S5